MTANAPQAKPASPSSSDTGQTPATSTASDPKAVMAERKALAAKMEALKNEKLRRQLEALEAETAEAKAAAKAHSSAAKDLAAPKMQAHVPSARFRLRHFVALVLFATLVVLPVSASVWYLNARAADRYVSYSGFSVRTEEIGSSFDIPGLAEISSSSSSSDTDILYKFIQSPEMVARVDAQIDLRSLWGAPGQEWRIADHDPVFSYNPEGAFRTLFSLGLEEAGQDPLADIASDRGSIEDLTEYWARMVKVYSDSGTGLIDLEVQAFDPDEAQLIAQMVYDESSAMINRLSSLAREDATRYAREERDLAVERLTTARQALTAFRLESGIVDPNVTITEQQGLITPLQSQLAQAFIDLDIIREANPNDPRIVEGERRVQVIEDRIRAEREKQGLADEAGENSFAVDLAEWERLSVDLQFAQNAYTVALAAYDTALAEAQRQSRYLAAHVSPTLPESATEPSRGTLVALVGLFSLMAWAILVLAGYALRDRR